MIKMEIRATPILFAKRNAKQKRDEEPLQQFSNLQEQLRSSFNGIPVKLKLIESRTNFKKKTYWKQYSGRMLRTKARCYVFRKKKQQILL